MGELLTLDIEGEEKPLEQRHKAKFPCCGFETECHCHDTVKRERREIALQYVLEDRL